jgi:hypothetical protein
MKKAVFHGECVISKTVLPNGVKKVDVKGDSYIIADSETTGNHHLVAVKDGCELYEKDGVLYLENEVETEVFCVDQSRHDTITLEPGVWKIDRAKEYDFLKDEVRRVAD